MAKFSFKARKGFKNIKNDGSVEKAKPFILAEIVLLVLFSVFLDVYELIALVTTIAFIGFLLELFGFFLDFAWIFGANLVFFLKRGRWALNLAGSVIELIPGLDALPIRTVALAIAIFLTNSSYGKLIGEAASRMSVMLLTLSSLVYGNMIMEHYIEKNTKLVYHYTNERSITRSS
jgi:multisubunit Na+/H+ antiporter MnhG subunit